MKPIEEWTDDEIELVGFLIALAVGVFVVLGVYILD